MKTKGLIIVLAGFAVLLALSLWMASKEGTRTGKIWTHSTVSEPVEKSITVLADLRSLDVQSVKASDYRREIEGLIPFVSEADKDFDLSKYRLSVMHYGDGRASEVLLSYWIGDRIRTDRGFTFILRDNTITRMVYRQEPYEEAAAGAISESELLSIVSKDQEKTPDATKEEEKEVVRDYYFFSYRSREMKRIVERYVFNGEVWTDQLSEQVLYREEPAG